MATFSTTGRVALNRIAASIFLQEKAHRVDLLWDSSEPRVGIQVNRNKGLYQLRFNPSNNGAVLSTAGFFNYIRYDWTKTRVFPATWDDKAKMLVVELPREHLSSTTVIRRKDKVRKADIKEQRADGTVSE